LLTKPRPLTTDAMLKYNNCLNKHNDESTLININKKKRRELKYLELWICVFALKLDMQWSAHRATAQQT